MIALLLALTGAAATPAKPAPSASVPDARVYRYRVHYGDSLIRLAADYLAGPDALKIVMKANNIAEQRQLRTNEVLVIPYRILRRAPVDGAVIAFRGPVLLGARAARIGDAVGEGMTISTGINASTSIRFPDGTIAAIPSNSRLRVLKLARYVLTAEVDRAFLVEDGGSEWQVIPARLPGDRLQVRTPVAVSAVRGTEFRVTYRRDGALSGSSVVKGEVAFAAGPGAAVPLPKGFGAVTDQAHTIDKRVLLEAPAFVAGFERQSGRDLRFAVTPVTGAKAYRAVIARDAGFVDIVGEVRTTVPRADFSDVADGAYFVRASAIDTVGLEGFARDASFMRNLVPIQAGEVRVANGETRFDWTYAGRRDGALRFVLSARADLSHPILDVADAPEDGITIAYLPHGSYYWRVSTDSPGAAATTGIQSVKLGRR